MKERRELRVFVADDSALARGGLIALLSRVKGIRVVGQAGDGLEATEAIAAIRPDVVVLDIHMPRRNGIEALKIIKKEDPSPVVIMFSADERIQTRDNCRKAGADFVFDKASQFDELIATLKALARNGKLDQP
jgi:DNA-binding NarL/FixJ family response regulator